LKVFRIVDRYILREFLSPFFLGIFIFTFVLLISQSRRLMDMVVVGNASAFIVLKILACIIPSFLVLTLPMTILLASVVTFGRLSADSEIVAMMASGITIKHLAKPIFIISTIGYLITFFLSAIVVPKSNRMFRETVMNNVQQTILTNIQEGIFNDAMRDIIIYVKHIERDKNRFHGVFIADYRRGKEPTTIFAREGVIGLDPVTLQLKLELLDGNIQLAEKKNQKRFGDISFRSYRMKIDMDKIFHKRRKKFKLRREWALSRLINEIKKAKDAGKPYLPMETDLIKKFSLPVSCFILGMVSLPLGISIERGNKNSGFSKCILLFIGYYMLWNAFESIAKTGVLNPYFALWVPNIVMGTVAVLMFINLGKVPRGHRWGWAEDVKRAISRIVAT